jgi:type I restriction enzyme S subunit
VKPGWRLAPFDAVIADESGGNLKTPQSEFLAVGRYAVVDQGKQLIAGYVNDQSRLCRVELPAIVFGDHTRCLKYVDFPFCMGADGTKVLRPKIDADVKYLYHYLRQLRLTEGGYDRHFKYLKRTEIVLPPLPEQQRIAEVLDRAEALRAKRRATIAQLDALTQSIFLDMFGDPRIAGSTGTAPASARQIGQLTRIRTGKLDANAADEGGRYPFFTCAVEPLRINTPAYDCKAVLVAGNGDLNVKYFEGKFNAYQRTYVIESVDESVLLPGFLYGFLNLYVSELRKQAIGGVIKYIKLPYLTEAVMQLPPLPSQLDFSRHVTSVERLKAAYEASLAQLGVLFSTLQYRAFRDQV